VVGRQNDKNPRTLFKCPISQDLRNAQPYRLDIPTRDSIISLRLKRHALPISQEIGQIRVPVAATLQGDGVLRLPIFCSKDLPRVMHQVRQHDIVLCYVTVSFQDSFQSAFGPAYDNEALPWQLQALTSLAQAQADHAFAGRAGMLIPPSPQNAQTFPYGNVDVVHNSQVCSVFHEFIQVESRKGSEYSKDVPVYIEFIRCRELPKMDTFGTCDCFITCGDLTTECVKNTQYDLPHLHRLVHMRL
jgi:hypothetical protein